MPDPWHPDSPRQTRHVRRRSCVSMLADLFNADDPSHACGTSTIGSSEAILLGGLAMKRRWMARRKAEGKSTDNPNIVMGSEVHVRRLFCPAHRP